MNLDVFIAITGAAVLLQACVLLAMYVTMRKSSQRMEALAAEVKAKVLPTIDEVQATLTEIRPRLQVIAANLEHTTNVVRAQVERTQATVSDTRQAEP